MYLIVGLGNPEKKYFNTYHNVGFMVVDDLCKKLGVTNFKEKCKALAVETKIENEKIIIAKPLTYMNLSGESVLALATKFKIAPENIFVAVDDIDLPKGKIRFRENGSSGTHNGLRNIVSCIGTEFKRIRVGIGKPEDNMDLADYVLSEIDLESSQLLAKAIDEASNLIISKVGGTNV